MLIGMYTEPLNKDKLNTQHFIQSDRKLKFMRNKRAIRRSFGRQMERTEGAENYRNDNVRSYGESEVGHSYSSGTHGQRFLHHQLSQLKGAVCFFRLHT